jgi:hypothetical protein
LRHRCNVTVCPALVVGPGAWFDVRRDASRITRRHGTIVAIVVPIVVPIAITVVAVIASVILILRWRAVAATIAVVVRTGRDDVAGIRAIWVTIGTVRVRSLPGVVRIDKAVARLVAARIAVSAANAIPVTVAIAVTRVNLKAS